MSYTDPCLGPSGVGLFNSQNEMTSDGRNAFLTQVLALLASGNADGKGAKISTLLGIPHPPVPGPKLFDPDRLILHPSDPIGSLFWFDPSPLAPLSYSALQDPNGFYQTRIVNNLYVPLMRMLNLKGNAVAPPILDFSGFLPPELNITLPDLPKIPALLLSAPAFKAYFDISLPDALKFIADLNAIIPIPDIPKLPSIPLPEFDFVIFPKLFLELLKVPIVALPNLIIKLSADIPSLLIPTPDVLFKLCLGVLIIPILDLLANLDMFLILPKLLSATFIVILQNLASALAIAAVSQIIGTGIVVKFIGQGLGLA